MTHKKPQQGEDSFLSQFLTLPRATRILLASVFAIAVTLAVSPVVDEFYLRYFFSEETRILPSLVSAGIGLMMYVIGWVAIVGIVGEDVEARRIVKAYLVVGALSVVVVIIWVLRLLVIGGGT